MDAEEAKGDWFPKASCSFTGPSHSDWLINFFLSILIMNANVKEAKNERECGECGREREKETIRRKSTKTPLPLRHPLRQVPRPSIPIDFWAFCPRITCRQMSSNGALWCNTIRKTLQS